MGTPSRIRLLNQSSASTPALPCADPHGRVEVAARSWGRPGAAWRRSRSSKKRGQFSRSSWPAMMVFTSFCVLSASSFLALNFVFLAAVRAAGRTSRCRGPSGCVGSETDLSSRPEPQRQPAGAEQQHGGGGDRVGLLGPDDPVHADFGRQQVGRQPRLAEPLQGQAVGHREGEQVLLEQRIGQHALAAEAGELASACGLRATACRRGTSAGRGA